MFKKFAIIFILNSVIQLTNCVLSLSPNNFFQDVPDNQRIVYQVSMQYKNQHFCGGSIIAPHIVLTAAHCVDIKIDFKYVSIYAGINKLSDDNGQRRNVTAFLIHERYRTFEQYDIALVQLQTAFDYVANRVGEIDFRNKNRLGGGVSVHVTGWGSRFIIITSIPVIDNLFTPNKLKRITYRTITNEQCKKFGLGNITEHHICTRGMLSQGVCPGDSGGPLVQQTEKGIQQVGIVSFGYKVCRSGILPDGYVRVTSFVDWINTSMNNLKNFKKIR